MNIAAPAIWRSTCLNTQATSSYWASVSTPSLLLRSIAKTAIRLHHSIQPSSLTTRGLPSSSALPKHEISLAHSVRRIWPQSQRASFSANAISVAQYARSTATKKPTPRERAVDPASLPLETPASIRKIFGRRTVDPHKGNRLLRQLQDRRVTGTLDTPTSFPQKDVDRALTWLRKAYPIDEDAAIIARLDREDAAEAQSYLPQARAAEPGVLERQRAANAAKAAKEEAERIRQKAEEGAKRIEGPQSKAVSARKEAAAARREANRAWVKKYEERVKKQGLDEVPNMTILQRLVPSTIFVATVVILCLWFADQYIPPSPTARLFPDLPRSVATIAGITAINFLVFLGWHYPPVWQVLNKYFILVPAYPYCVSMLLNFFSHQKWPHLCVNTVFLLLVGAQLHDDIGRGPFLALYLAAGCLSAYITLSVYVAKAYWSVATLGASGAISGLMTCWFTIHLESGITVPFLPDFATTWMSPLLIMALLITHDAFGTMRHFMTYGKQMKLPPTAPVDHLSHLGGYAVGIVTGMYMRWTRREREKQGKAPKDEMDVGRMERMMRKFIEAKWKVSEGNQEGKGDEKGGRGAQ